MSAVFLDSETLKEPKALSRCSTSKFLDKSNDLKLDLQLSRQSPDADPFSRKRKFIWRFQMYRSQLLARFAAVKRSVEDGEDALFQAQRLKAVFIV
ncbi:hypothetical protein N7465_010011 [Penicillium sp. CMV-2018d]|nr:hypothetical protein N7465_010011 [Penicillium sp. CMV-2018d]